ncbi:hypothetical protein [Sphingobium algorifonticola]|uniref:MBL fold metallo-hydrolase n=1 Tax=Sphingobium algorifonticola TaxID=2008318 RepID=A0A437JCW4_9SPHN|nr:hypothetical protein [Sphingobium algorifonticola]RVT43756.1 hypothetical protein ENE74_03920 [Sphingobium algorifonticola]
MFDPGFDDFVAVDEAPMRSNPREKPVAAYLLWGDGVRRLPDTPVDGWVHVAARGQKGWVRQDDLGGESLLEIYFIDVGQGDGILVKTPDFRHVMIDGGLPRASQFTNKSGADFVDWKFFRDYGSNVIALDMLIASHNDYDHFGGLSDLLDVDSIGELDARTITVETFAHAGLSWWRREPSGRTLGDIAADDQGNRHFTQLIDDRASAQQATGGSAHHPQLQGSWSQFIARALAARTAAGAPVPFVRLGRSTGMLPGFDAGDVKVAVLGPVDGMLNGAPTLPVLDSDSKSTNGNSVLLRIDYGKARILLTGDLNRQSQALILDAVGTDALACDVAKACHHGSEDISMAFLEAVHAAATVISSGDGEGHDHPRPRIVAASGLTGFVEITNDQIVTPLVYSTELARSVTIAEPVSLDIAVPGTAPLALDTLDLRYARIAARERKVIGSRTYERRLSGTKLVGRLIYGLVNVRTDGKRILCATMNEADGSWSLKSFKARF